MRRYVYVIYMILMLSAAVIGCGKEKIEAEDSILVAGSLVEEEQNEDFRPEIEENNFNEATDHGEMREGASEGFTYDAKLQEGSSDESSEEKIYEIDTYGTLETKRQEYIEETTGQTAYYYEIDEFYFKETFPKGINESLQQLYQEYETGYQKDAEVYRSGVDEFGEEYPNVPYNYYHLLGIQYVGDDYISILFNNIAYMGGAHPYSMFDSITLDCETGKELMASELMGEEDDIILEKVSESMGLDVMGTWDEIDFYLTDDSIVFYYRQPNWWDDVIFSR